MDLEQDRAGLNADEDRISNLPDDIIHHILSFLDMKYAVQTTALSHKWKLIWTSMPCLNLSSHRFGTLPQFATFVKHALSHHNRRTELSAVKVTFTGAATKLVVKQIINYAYSHNVRQLTLIWDNSYVHEFPHYIFSSHTLKHLTLSTHLHKCVPNSPWEFPSLETLNLMNIQFDDATKTSHSLFSKCVNLKDLTLHGFSIGDLEIFNICVPRLSNLTITNGYKYPKVFNVVAPQLKNLTASVKGTSHIYNPYSNSLQLSTPALDCLEKVNLSLSMHNDGKERDAKKRDVRVLLDLFRKLFRTKVLILDLNIIETLSSCLDELSHEPCPFDNLKCLKIDMKQQKSKYCMIIPTQVRNYFLENSHIDTFITDLAQGLKKRSRQLEHNDTMAKKVAKLEAEKQQLDTIAEEKKMLEGKMKMQDQVIEVQKAMLKAANLQHEILISQIIKCKMAELKVQVESGNLNYDLIRSMGFDIKSVMDMIPESLRVNAETCFSSQYEEVKSLFLNLIDGSQWAKIETELGNMRQSEKTRSDNIQSQ